MKYLLTLFILTSIAQAFSEKKEKLFEVSKVKSDKTDLILAFKKVQDLEVRKQYSFRTFHVFQVIDKNKFLVHPGGWTVDNPNWINHNITYYVETLEPKNLVDGSKLSVWFSKKTGTKTYTNTLGVNKTVKSMQEVIPVKITQKEFVTRLKSGEIWTFHTNSKKRCKTCFGKGKVRPKKRNAGDSVMKKCPTCYGKKEITTTYKWTVKW